jgi:hypothetical protein
MKQWEEKVGKTFLGRLDEVVLRIGKTRFTRREIIEKLRCGNMVAAARLSWALERLKPVSARELSNRIDIEDLLTIKGVGVATIYVWMCVLDSLGKDPEDWLDREAKVPTIYNKKHRRK